MRVLPLALLLATACGRKELANAADAGPPPVLANAVGGLVPGLAPAEKPATVANAAPRFVGRWVAEPGGGMRAGWPGAYVTGRFFGTHVSARIEDDGNNLFQVVVDGEPKQVLRTDKARGPALYELADGLPEGVHDIALHKRTEAKVGEVVFHAFEARNGDRVTPMLTPQHVPTRLVEIVGDSISTGYGNEGPGASCTYVNREQSEYATYGAIAARQLGADHVTTAWSGKTLHEMKELFDVALPGRTDGPRWEFAQAQQPDAVVLNLGTNNFANIDPGEKKYVTLWLDLVHTVRAAYPKAYVVVTLGSMLSDVYPPKRRSLTQARKYTKVAMAKLSAEGETNIGFLELPEQNHTDGLGCGFHPSLKTHQLMGDRLAAFLREHLGW